MGTNGPDDPDLLLARLGRLLSKGRVSDKILGDVVAGLKLDSVSATPAERDTVERLRRTLTLDEWDCLEQLLRRMRDGERVQTVGGAEFRRARLKAEAEERAATRAQERAEAEARAVESRRVEAKAEAIRRIDDGLKNDYLGCDALYESRLREWVTEADYLERKHAFVRAWLLEHTEWKPDDEQLAAVAATSHDILVSARAGSGKTSVLVNRALFLMGHCGVRGDQILLLAFNVRAAQEIRDRISVALSGVSWNGSAPAAETRSRPHVSTFHAMAYAIVRPEGRIVTDDPGPVQSEMLQREVDEICRDPVSLQRVREILTEFFTADLEPGSALGLSVPQKIDLARNSSGMALDGTWVKSYGEKVIANFLFERSVPYWYEKAIPWNGRHYRPDFTLDLPTGKKLVIEYFGLRDAAYVEARMRKKEWLQGRDWPLIEIEPQDVAGRDLAEVEGILEERLEPHLGPLRRLPADELWQRCSKKHLLEFSRSLNQFVGRCRQMGLTPSDLRRLKTESSLGSPILDSYYVVAADAYEAYLARLATSGDEDFSGLLLRAIERVDAGVTDFVRVDARGVDRVMRPGDVTGFRHILVDEFQDCAPLFNNLVQSIRAKSGAAQFSVGDDWQAINGFAGSDLRFFHDYPELIGPAEHITIPTNYRSRPEIVKTGNRLMAGLGTPSRSTRTAGGVIQVWDISRMHAAFGFEREMLGGDPNVIAALRLALLTLNGNDTVHVLTRRRSPQLERQISDLPTSFSERISTSTTHKFKGRECSAVVVMDVQAGAYPLIHPFWIFGEVLGDSLQSIEAAEQRLLYVALSRAVDEMHVVVDGTRPSRFVPRIEEFPWARRELNDLPTVESTLFPGRHVLVTISGGNSRDIRNSLKDAGFRWDSARFRWARFFPGTAPTVQDVLQQAWAQQAHEVRVTIHTTPPIQASVSSGQARPVSSVWG